MSAAVQHHIPYPQLDPATRQGVPDPLGRLGFVTAALLDPDLLRPIDDDGQRSRNRYERMGGHVE